MTRRTFIKKAYKAPAIVMICTTLPSMAAMNSGAVDNVCRNNPNHRICKDKL